MDQLDSGRAATGGGVKLGWRQLGPRHWGAGSREWWLQSLIGSLVIAYGLSALVVHRPANGYTTLWDGWDYNLALALPVVPVAWHVRRCARQRTAWSAMGAGSCSMRRPTSSSPTTTRT